MSNTVHVKNISSETRESEIRDFFSFCGKISSLTVSSTGATQSTDVTFEKATAAKTALLLDNTQLGPNVVQVSSSTSASETSAEKSAYSETEASHDDHVAQEDKPRSRIIAEYLAKGYKISDTAVQKALDLDQQHGVSSTFTTALTNFDQRLHARETAEKVDSKYGITETATAGWRSLNSYFEKALGTPSGQKVRDFYVAGNKQVMDVHNEAMRLAGLENTSATKHTPEKVGEGKTHCNCGGAEGKCGCKPGECTCSNCAKKDVTKEEVAKTKYTVPGTQRTKCECGGGESICACAPGECACGDCGKNTST